MKTGGSLVVRQEKGRELLDGGGGGGGDFCGVRKRGREQESMDTRNPL